MKLQIKDPVGWLTFDPLDDRLPMTISRDGVRAVLAAIDAGRLDALRHYAQHGTLPPEPPVWPGLRVRVGAYGSWEVYDAENACRAIIAPHNDGYRCTLQSGGAAPYGSTPQASVDTARAWLAERWGLST